MPLSERERERVHAGAVHTFQGGCLNDFMAGLTRWLIRVVLLVAGLVLFLSLLAAALVLALAWGLRTAWARLTGRPVVPWTMRVDPRSGWSTVYRSSARWKSGRAGAAPGADAAEPRDAARRGGLLPGAGEVTDVQPRDL